MSRSNRFHSANCTFNLIKAKTPSVWDYRNDKQINMMGISRGGKVGRETRPAFTDQAAKSSFTPGPGNYKNPTEFGHYKKMQPFV